MLSFIDYIKKSATPNIEDIQFKGSADLEVPETKVKSYFFNKILK